MAYKIFYGHHVGEDISKLSQAYRKRIKVAIEAKLTENPVIFGKPLRESLKNYRSLRVGDYRVGFKIDKKNVYVLGIVHRSKAYREFLKRIKN